MIQPTPHAGIDLPQLTTLRSAAQRLEVAYLLSQLSNVLDLLDARDALLRDLRAAPDRSFEDVLEWDRLVQLWADHGLDDGCSSIGAVHRLVGEVLGV